MTYDDWKTTDDTPQPDPNRCEACVHPEGYCDCKCCHEGRCEGCGAYGCNGTCRMPEDEA